MSLPRLAVDRPVTGAMILVSVLVVGAIACFKLPLAFLPSVDAPFIYVRVVVPNSNPAQVEREVTKPVEEALATLSGIKKLRSETTADDAGIVLEFNWGRSLDIVRAKVSEKLDEVRGELPETVRDILIYSFSTDDIAVVQARIAAHGVDLSRNYDLLESRVVNRLRRIPGVARVDLGGVEPREVRVDLVLDEIREHGIDVSALIRDLQAASRSAALGKIEERGSVLRARALGSFASLDELGEVPIGNGDLRLGDVAEISFEEPPLNYGRHLDGQEAIALEIFKESTANTVEVVRAVMELIEGEIADDPLLEGIDVFTWQDQGEEITNGLEGLTKAGLWGGLFAVIVLYLFLRRVGSTLIVSLTIPFSIIAACGVMYLTGMSLNILSMSGLMLGIGMLVDNSVVVLESIDRESRRATDAKQAAISGAQQVGLAVTAATTTSLIVFLPLVVGGTNELVVWLKEIGLTISIALACSLGSSLILIPLVSSRLLAPRPATARRPLERVERVYARVLGWTLRHPAWSGLIAVAAFGAGLTPLFAGWVSTEMLAGGINRRIHIEYDFADFVYKSEAERYVDRIEAYLEGNADRFPIGSIYSYFADDQAATTINLSRTDLLDREVAELREKIRDDLPTLPGCELRFARGESEGQQSFAVRLYGPDSDDLQRFAIEAEQALAQVDGLRDLGTSVRRGRDEVQVEVDSERAQRVGLTPGSVSDVLGFTLGGTRLRGFRVAGRDVDAWVALRLEDRSNIADIETLPVGTGSEGQTVRLGEVARFERVPKAIEIRRQNRQATVAVTGTYAGQSWEEARGKIEESLEGLALPPGAEWSWGERILEQDQQSAQMGTNFLLALLLVYLVMAALFESTVQPLAILVSIPFALPGVAWFLMATQTPFNIMAQIGLLILMGIVVNNGIVLLDHVNQKRREGLEEKVALVEAGRARMRPILMTAFTTIFGLIPLAIGSSGVGGAYYFPLARTVMGGLMSSTLLTLLVLPLIHLGFVKLTGWAQRVWIGSGGRGVPAEISAGPVSQA
jgi:HAE1 family hydrophobic/amphiphilic exporter-1